MALSDREWLDLIDRRATDPDAAASAMRNRRRRPLLTDGRLFIIAADHTARGALGVGDQPFVMADRRRMLDALMVALCHALGGTTGELPWAGDSPARARFLRRRSTVDG